MIQYHNMYNFFTLQHQMLNEIGSLKSIIKVLKEEHKSLCDNVSTISNEIKQLKRRRNDDIPLVEPPQKKRKKDKVNDKVSLPSYFLKKWSQEIKSKISALKIQTEEKSNITLIIEDIIEQDHFSQIFDGKGEIIHPTTDSYSSIIIKKMSSFSDIENTLGKENICKEYQALEWSYPEGSFLKSHPIRQILIQVRSLDVNYHKEQRRLDLKFSFFEENCDT